MFKKSNVEPISIIDGRAPKVDNVSDLLGNFGIWHMAIFVGLFYVEAYYAIFLFQTTFLVPVLKYSCNGTAVHENHCPSQGNSATCPNLSFDRDVFHNKFSTIVEELDLVCSRSWLVSFSSTLIFFGQLGACLTCGYIADRYGRKPTLLAAIIPAVLGIVLTFFPKHFAIFAISRILCGFASHGYNYIFIVLVMEICGDKQRHYMNLARLGLPIGCICLGLFSDWLRDWMKIHEACTILVCALPIMTIFVPESPRWLLAQNKLEECKSVIERALKINRTKIDNLDEKIKILASKLQQERAKDHRYTFLDIIRTPNLRKKTIITCLVWAFLTFVVFGLALNGGTFGVNQFVTFILLETILIPGYSFSVVLMKFIGCKHALVLNMVFGTLFAIVTGIVGNGNNTTFLALLITMKFFASTSWCLIYNYTGEIFPTTVRSIALGNCSTAGIIMCMVSPFVKELTQITSITCVMFIFAALLFTCGILLSFLPNTFNKPLSETLEDGEKIPLEFIFRCRSRNLMVVS